MCGRLLGRLLGTTRSNDTGDRPTGHPVAFLAYRPMDPPTEIVPYTPGLRFRCQTCGGAGALDDIDVLSTYEDLPAAQGDAEHVDPKHGPGRPPSPFPINRRVA
jgi:hypothetical protein